MEWPDLRDTFRQHLNRRRMPDPLTPRALFEAMSGFYRDVRVDGCDATAGNDSLLVQWGTYDWRDGSGRHFEFDVTRQLIAEPGEDENIWQLSFTLRFPPEESLVAPGKGSRWCMSPGEADGFAEGVKTMPAYGAVRDRPGDPKVLWECAG